MKREDLKQGMLVVDDKSIIRIVYGDCLMSLDDGGFKTETFDSDWISKWHSNKKIMKIYSPPINLGTGSFNYFLGEGKESLVRHCTLLWERQDTKEMTVAEIAKELGYKVKVIE